MLEVTSKDWYINQKSVPTEEDSEYKSFWDYQKNICLNGCTIDGIFIPGTLYFHLNFWNTAIDYKNENGKSRQKYANPLLRDNEWLIFNAIEEAERQQKGLCLFGSRRISKTTTISSYMSYGATFDENSQNVISGLNSQDIKLITDAVDKGLNKLPDAWKWQRIEDNWKQQVTLGVKTKDNTRIPFSQILIRNLDDGNNEEAIAGTKPRRLVIDEGGKGDFLKALQAAIPGFTTPDGWGCSPIVTGTGGDMKKFQNAKELFFSPDAFNFLSFSDEDNHKRVHGLFLGAKYRLEGKDKSDLGNYLNKTDSDLNNIPMMVSNEEKAFNITDKDIEARRLSGDKGAFLKERMYFPKKVDDIFLNSGTNIFNVDAINKQQEVIRNFGSKAFEFEMYSDGTEIKAKSTEKQYITEFPVKSQNKDAPVMIWEHPVPDAPPFLYVGGIDSYRHGKSVYSDSLGSVYIFKRMHNIVTDMYQNVIVASYVARPDDPDVWHEQARMLIKYYNAYTLVENDELSFINHMKYKGDAIKYLAPQPPWLKQITPFTTQDRDFGISRSSDKVRDHLKTLVKKYLDEVIHQEYDENGEVLKEFLGVTRIFDLMLLEELKQYTDDLNVDRIVGFSLCLAQVNWLDPLMGAVGSSDSDPRLKAIFSREKKHQLFTKPKSSFLRNLRR